MSDLVEFLRARLDEDEQVAQKAHRNEQRVDGTDHWFSSHSDAIVSMAPHRAVAEVEAKRRIIGLHGVSPHECVEWDRGLGEVCIGYDDECPTLRLLALPYADHPDYREEWKP